MNINNFRTYLFIFFFALAQCANNAFGEEVAPAKRYALLIGVNDYRPADYVEDSNKPRMFKNLITPCDDIDKISAQLQKLGWRGEQETNPEIASICNADIADIVPKLGALVEDYENPNDLLFIYIASHGVEINNRNYFFTKRALLDLKKAGKRLLDDPSNLLFQHCSFELNQEVYARASDFYKGNIFLVLDSCRDDPFYATMKSELPLPVSVPTMNNRKQGIMLLYAAMSGKRISDGSGSSFLSNSLISAMSKGGTIDKIVSNVIKDVSNNTRYTNFPQHPDTQGKLNNPDICFSGCDIKANGSTLEKNTESGQTKASLRQRDTDSVEYFADASKVIGVASDSSISESDVKPSAKAKSSTRKFKTIHNAPQELATASQSGLILDVYWCEGGGQKNREQKANAFAEKLSMSLKNKEISDPTISQIRVRSLGADENARPGYRLTKNVIRVDRESGQQMTLANKIKATSSTDSLLQIQSIRAQNIGSLSVFYCDGIPAFKPLPRMWLQAAYQEQKGMASLLGQSVAEEISDLWVADAVEIVKNSPDQTQIRYFFKQDEPLAEKVANIVATRLGNKPLVSYVRGYQEKVESSLVELWVGKLENVRPLNSPLIPVSSVK